MARVCIGCGLTTTTDGRLIVDTGDSVWPYGCADINGAPVYCCSDGALRVDPTKSRIRSIQYGTPLSGGLFSSTFNAPEIGGGNTDFGTQLTYLLTNPSDCLPMSVAVLFGVEHVGIQRAASPTDPTDDLDLIFGTHLNVTGGIVSGPHDAHQRWQFAGEASSVRWDAMGSTRTIPLTLAAGGTATFNVQPYVNVVNQNGFITTTITNYEHTLDVDAWH